MPNAYRVREEILALSHATLGEHELSGKYASFSPNQTCELDVRTLEQREYPLITQRALRGGMEISGYLVGERNPALRAMFEGGHTATLAWMQLDGDFFHVSDHLLSDFAQEDDEGLFIFNGTATRSGSYWHGDLLSGTQSAYQLKSGYRAFLYVRAINAGNVTVRFAAGGVNYDVQRTAAGLSLVELMSSGNNPAPVNTAGTLSATASAAATSVEFYWGIADRKEMRNG